MTHEISVLGCGAIYIDNERVFGSKPYGLFSTVNWSATDEDLKRIADRCLELIADSKTENNSEKPNNSTISKMEQVEDEPQTDDLQDWKDRMWAEAIVTEPKTQTETQNSNLTFEKDECAEEYEELGLKELKELIETDRKDEFFREPTAEERKAVADYIDSISVPTGVNVFDLMDEPQTERSE